MTAQRILLAVLLSVAVCVGNIPILHSTASVYVCVSMCMNVYIYVCVCVYPSSSQLKLTL